MFTPGPTVTFGVRSDLGQTAQVQAPLPEKQCHQRTWRQRYINCSQLYWGHDASSSPYRSWVTSVIEGHPTDFGVKGGSLHILSHRLRRANVLASSLLLTAQRTSLTLRRLKVCSRVTVCQRNQVLPRWAAGTYIAICVSRTAERPFNRTVARSIVGIWMGMVPLQFARIVLLPFLI